MRHTGAASRRPRLADIFRACPDLAGVSAPQRRVVRAITRCRTAALGGHVWACDRCGWRGPVYNSCRDRHCPQCQALDAARWAAAREAEFLPVPYFHVVFTVPPVLHGLLRANPRRGYGLLMQAAAAALLEVAATSKRLGARLGVTAVLHTWTQRLAYHPHVHCLVPGGGLSVDGTRWVAARPNYLVPVKALSPVFRAKLLKALERGLARGELHRPPSTPPDALRQASWVDWVVYAKPTLAGPESVVRYLAGYAHRIGLGNERLVAFEGDTVTFRWRDRAHDNARRHCTMDVATFARQYLQHVLPPGFVRLRHYGLFANPVRRANLARCRALLGVAAPPPSPPVSWIELLKRLTGRDVTQCAHCGEGRLAIIETLRPAARAPPASLTERVA